MLWYCLCVASCDVHTVLKSWDLIVSLTVHKVQSSCPTRQQVVDCTWFLDYNTDNSWYGATLHVG